MVGATAATVRSTDGAGAPATGVWVVVTPEVVFGLIPTLSDVTTTVTVQLPLAGMVMPLKASAVWLAVKLLVFAPTQVPAAAPVAFTRMLTRVSVKLALVSATPLVLARVKVMVEVPSALIVVGRKALLMVGVAAPTVKLTGAAGALGGAWSVVTAEVVFGKVPATSLVMTTVTVQVLLAGMVMPVKLSAVWPAVKLLVLAPTQVPAAAPTALMLMLTSVSVKLALVSAMPLVLPKTNVMVEVPSAAIVVGRKALVMVGATAVTVRLAVFDTAPASGVWVVVTPLVVFGCTPTMSEVTTTVTVQLPLAGMVRPLTVSAVWPAV